MYSCKSGYSHNKIPKITLKVCYYYICSKTAASNDGSNLLADVQSFFSRS